jgi:branched-chain amino acid transport system ATP-binding protein
MQTLTARIEEAVNSSLIDEPADEKNLSRPSPVLAAEGLVVGYGSAPVVFGIDIEVRPGQVTALLGANGAGKSTTLLALAGELSPMEGNIRLEGQVVRSPLYRRARKGLVYVPEERSIFRAMSCGDNLRVGRADHRLALEIFPELESHLGTRAGLLSGGEQQMLTLARALSLKPKVLLVDEVSLGLAPLIVLRLFRAIREAANQGAGVILVEQHIRQAMAIADYVYIMRQGRIEIEGPANELMQRIDEIERAYLA